MDGYQEFLLTVRRDINCLSDTDRRTRQGAAGRLQKALFDSGKTCPEFACKLFLEELHKPLFRMFGDQTEKCREIAIAMSLRYLDLVPTADLENVLPLLLAAVRGRLWTIPFPEQCEELRLETLRLLSHLFDVCKDRLNPFASDILDVLSKALTDSCPDAKKECCEITKKVSANFDAERVSRACGPLVASLLANLKHQQWKVRRATLDSLGALLSLEAPMLDHMEDVLPHLNALLNDRTAAVRQCLGEVVERWLLKGLRFKEPKVTNFDDDESPVGFEKFEPRLLLLLLSVAADEDTEQVAPLALGALEKVGVVKHEMRQKRYEAAKARAQKAAEAKAQLAAAKGEEPPQQCGDALLDLPEPRLAPEYDYSAMIGLLPEPFASGRTPVQLTTAYVQLHLPAILPQVLSNLTQWTSDIRTAAARLLRVILVLVNRQVAPFLDQVLVHLYKASADDEGSVSRAALQSAEMAGTFVEVGLVLALVAKHLGLKIDGGPEAAWKGQGVEELWPEARAGRQVTRTVQDVAVGVKNFTASTVENKRQVFAVLAHLLRPMAPANGNGEAISALSHADLRATIRFLEEGGQSDELLPWVLGALRALLNGGGAQCSTEWPRIFDLLLRMRSGEECDAASVDAAMDQLASFCSRSRRELYEEHLRSRLGDLLKGAEVQLWEERDPKRHVLETLLRNAGSAAASHIASLVPVLARQASPEDAAPPARIDLLGLVHFLIASDDPAMVPALHDCAPALLSDVLIPNCTWRAGQSNNKIRKGGMVCIHQMFQKRLLTPAALNAAFSDLLPILKSCLDDSFSPDNRSIACHVLGATLVELQADMSSDQLREIYPELLKRLDDSQDAIRVTVCDALSMFFKCLPPNWSRSLYEYILRTLFVHLDDPNPQIQQAIYSVLESAAHQDHATFAREAQVAAGKSSHPRLCEELGRLAASLRQASTEE